MTESTNIEEISLADLLTSPKRRKFAVLYAQNGGKGTAAAEGAGFSHPSVEQHRLLKDANVLKAIQRQLRAQMLSHSENRDTIIAREVNWANCDIRGYFRKVLIIDENGLPKIDTYSGDKMFTEEMIPITDWTEKQGKAVKKISWNREGPVIEMMDAARANRNLAEYEGMLQKDDNNLTADDAASLIAASMAAMDGTDAPESQ